MKYKIYKIILIFINVIIGFFLAVVIMNYISLTFSSLLGNVVFFVLWGSWIMVFVWLSSKIKKRELPLTRNELRNYYWAYRIWIFVFIASLFIIWIGEREPWVTIGGILWGANMVYLTIIFFYFSGFKQIPLDERVIHYPIQILPPEKQEAIVRKLKRMYFISLLVIVIFLPVINYFFHILSWSSIIKILLTIILFFPTYLYYVNKSIKRDKIVTE